MNWSEFKSKYKNEIRVGVIVFIAMMLIRLVKSILNSAYYRQVVKRFKEKMLYYYIQECLSVQDVKMILHR